MRGILYHDFIEHDSFIHAKSVFPDAWYNYIVPKSFPDQLERKLIADTIVTETSKGIPMTYYVHDDLVSAYDGDLARGELYGDDTFISVRLSSGFPVKSADIAEPNSKNTAGYIALAKVCFPDWENEGVYTKLFLDYGAERYDRTLKTFLLEDGEGVAAFGSFIFDTTNNLTYLHNFGTRPESRNHGYFSEIVKYGCNLALRYGIEEAYAIVEKGKGSYRALARLGFETKETFHMYSTE